MKGEIKSADNSSVKELFKSGGKCQKNTRSQRRGSKTGQEERMLCCVS